MALTPRSPYGAQSHDEPHFRRAPAPESWQTARSNSRDGGHSTRRRDAGSPSASARPAHPSDGYRSQQGAQARQSSSERPTVRLASGSSRNQAANGNASWNTSDTSANSWLANEHSNTERHHATGLGSNAQEPQRRPFGTPREPMPQLRGHQQRSYYGRGRAGRNSVIGQPLGGKRGRGHSSLNLSRTGRGFGGHALGVLGRRTVAAYDGPIRVRRIAVCLVTVLLTIVTWFAQTTSTGIAPTAEASMLDMQIMPLPSIPISTPKSEWKKGEAPHLYQTDPIWSTKSYGGGTIHDNACGPTALTMVYVYVTGKTDMTPLTMATWADAHGYAPTGATEWTFMTEGAASFGLTSTMINSDRETITSALKAGKPVIALMNEGDFTLNGHFIVLTDIDEYGNVTINDPYSGYRSSHTWPIATVCRQSTYSWVFEV